MPSFFWALGAMLLATLVAGLFRVARGPSPADRMMAAQLFGTTGTGILLVLAVAMNRPSLADVAVVLALLAAVLSSTFVRTVWKPPAT